MGWKKTAKLSHGYSEDLHENSRIVLNTKFVDIFDYNPFYCDLISHLLCRIIRWRHTG